jgi:uncharacterized 2Fe-2S/4Fe-4S cluster protein (DUF4445 family)
VVVVEGAVRRRSAIRLSAADISEGYALACQTVVEGDATVRIPPQEQIERKLVTDRVERPAELPFAYQPEFDQPIRVLDLAMDAPDLGDNTDDQSRLLRAIQQASTPDMVRQLGRSGPVGELPAPVVPLGLLRHVGELLRSGGWKAQAVVETDTWNSPRGWWRVVDVRSGAIRPFGLAIDIGTTTVTTYLVDLNSGQAIDHAAEYNGQISRGEDVISRIIYAGKVGGLAELGQLVRGTINGLIDRMCSRRKVSPEEIYRVTVVGNTTMIHLFLGIPPASIRLAPYIPAVNRPQPVEAGQIGLNVNPMASVDCLPGVASYVGSDITAGVVSSGMCDSQELTLFIDVGTNGEMALGTRDWLVSCACSAGPAFEGAGVASGMRATLGAIEEVWVNSRTLEPTVRVVGSVAPKGLCGSALLALLAEMFVTGVIDRSGQFVMDGRTSRVREGEHGGEYVVAWAKDSGVGRDIVITQTDLNNLMRAKSAIYAGFSVLASSVGLSLGDVQRVLIGGSFGRYLNVEKAVQIGLLPDLPWERFNFLGNTAIQGAYMALLSRDARSRVSEMAGKMTYLELSADNTFYDAFTAALFLPHTDISLFPSVSAVWEELAARAK